MDDAVAQLTVRTPEASRRALGILQELAAREPDNAYVQYNLGVAHRQLGQARQAEDAFARAIELDSALTRAYLGMGVLLEQQDRSRDAIRFYEQGVEADREDMELRSALIGALRRQGRLDEAIRQAREALKFNSKSLPVYNDLGLVYLDKDDLDMAEFVYLKALGQVKGAKQNADIRTNFGWTLYKKGDLLQARRQLEEAAQLDPRNLPTLIYLSHIYLDDRNFADAVPLLEAALEQEPDNCGVMVNLGVASRGLAEQIRASAEGGPDDPRIQPLLDRARELYQRALELQPDSPEPHRNLGILLGDSYKDYDAAIAAFEAYLEAGGEQSELVASYKEDVEQERERAERQRQREEERRRREQEKLERQRLLEQAEREKAESGGGAPGNDAGAGEPAPDAPSDAPSETPPPAEPAPDGEGSDGGNTDSPWGPQ